MNAELRTFLTRHAPMAFEDVTWGERMHLRATAYLSPDIPPLAWVTSVRAVVMCGGSVLVQQDRDSRHILPGGRREGSETLEATLRREVLEETGWSLGAVHVMGFIHFRHLDPEPPAYPYPYPDFLQIVFMAGAIEFSEVARLDDGYEVGSEFVAINEAIDQVPEIQQVYLCAATRMV